jgi:hypothetical protein
MPTVRPRLVVSPFMPAIGLGGCLNVIGLP